MGRRGFLRSAALFALAATSGACGGVSDGDAPATTSTVAVGVDHDLTRSGSEHAEATVVEDATPVDTTVAGARADLFVHDAAGGARPGVAVELRGPTTRRLRVDDDGRLVFTAPAGRYRIEVKSHCTDTYRVEDGGGGDLTLAEGEIARGDLVVDARLRYVPAAPTTYRLPDGREAGAVWKVGVRHLVEMPLTDLCAPSEADRLAPAGTTIPGASLRAVPGVEVEQRQLVIGSRGRLVFATTCTAPDVDVEVDLVDDRSPTHRHPTLTLATLEDRGVPFCVTNS